MLNKKCFAFRSAYIRIGFLALLGLASCNKTPPYTPTIESSNYVYDFWLEKTPSNTTLNRPYEGMISDSSIRLMVDYGTDITALEPTFYVYADSILPRGKQNFTNPVKYKVWSKGNTETYTVNISVSTIQTPNFVRVVSGFNHMLVLRNDGTLWACGDNSSGQLGLGDYSSRNTLTQVPVYNVVQVFTGGTATIVKLNDGTAWGVGNGFGELGLGNKNPYLFYTRVPFLDDAQQIAITFTQVWALKQDGTVWGAGLNNSDLFVQGDNDLHATFVKIPISGVKQLAAANTNIFVQKTTGDLWGWGVNESGELGIGDSLPRTTPVQILASGIVSKLFVGGGTTFIIDSAGKVWATGVNLSEQLGLVDSKTHYSFSQVNFFNGKAIDFIMNGATFTAFKESNGNVWTVGGNTYGQLGNGTHTALNIATPLQVPNFTASSLAGLGNTSFGLKSDGSLWGWGANTSGILGISPDSAAALAPTQIK